MKKTSKQTTTPVEKLSDRFPHGLSSNVSVAVQALLLTPVFSSNIQLPDARERFDADNQRELGKYGDIRVTQTAGARLDQNSHDVLLALIRLVCDKPGDKHVLSVNIDKLIQATGRGYRSASGRAWLLAELRRLSNAKIRIDYGTSSFVEFGFIDAVSFDERVPNEAEVELNSILLSSLKLQEIKLSLLDNQIRQKLVKNPLARCIYSFLAAHAKPEKMRESFFRKLADREGVRPSRWQADCAVKHKVSARTAYALFPDRTHFALSEIYGCRQTVFPGPQAPDVKKPAM